MIKSFISVLNKTVAIYEFGLNSKTSLLLIHGNSLHSEFFYPLIQHLEHDFHIITLDLPGHNFSESWNKEDYNSGNFGILFNSVLSYFNIKEVFVFGFSMGGFILLECFNLISSIKKIAIAGHPPIKKFTDMTEAYNINEDSALYLQGILNENEVERIYRSVVKINDNNIQSKILQSILDTNPAFREGCLNMAVNARDQINFLNESGCPITLIHAINDAVVKVDYFEKLKLNYLWEQKIQLISDSGHFVILEKPKEVSVILKRFFK